MTAAGFPKKFWGKCNKMKNKLTDLNDHLFMQIERLSDEDMTPEQLKKEAARAEALVKVSNEIVKNAGLQLKAVAFVASHGDKYRAPAVLVDHKPIESKPAPVLQIQKGATG